MNKLEKLVIEAAMEWFEAGLAPYNDFIQKFQAEMHYQNTKLELLRACEAYKSNKDKP